MHSLAACSSICPIHFSIFVKDGRSVSEKARRMPVAPRQQACVIFLKRSCPAVSQICILTSLSPEATTRDLKSTPMVAVYETRNLSSVKRVINAVLPTPPSPITSTFASKSWPRPSRCSFECSSFFILYMLQKSTHITSNHQFCQQDQQQQVAEHSNILPASLLGTRSLCLCFHLLQSLYGHRNCQRAAVFGVSLLHQAFPKGGQVEYSLQLLALLPSQSPIFEHQMRVKHSHLLEMHPLRCLKLRH